MSAPSKQELEGAVTSSARGQVGWKPQPDRPRAAPPTAEQLAEEARDPYGLKRAREEAAAPAPAAPKKAAPVVPFQKKTQDEIDDPYGLKAKQAARQPAQCRILDKKQQTR